MAAKGAGHVRASGPGIAAPGSRICRMWCELVMRFLRCYYRSRDVMAAIATVGYSTTPGLLFARGGPALVRKSRATSLDADTQLVERCLSGEQAAWEELVKIHTRRVYSICYRFTGSEAEAQDLSQEVFLRLFRSLPSFRVGQGSFPVWLARLTRNLLINH